MSNDSLLVLPTVGVVTDRKSSLKKFRIVCFLPTVGVVTDRKTLSTNDPHSVL